MGFTCTPLLQFLCLLFLIRKKQYLGRTEQMSNTVCCFQGGFFSTTDTSSSYHLTTQNVNQCSWGWPELGVPAPTQNRRGKGISQSPRSLTDHYTVIFSSVSGSLLRFLLFSVLQNILVIRTAWWCSCSPLKRWACRCTYFMTASITSWRFLLISTKGT